MRSKSRAGIADQLIELRIALESLYVPDTRGEARFRLSTHGAWHLGATFEERREYQRILRDAYDLASTAVHTGEVEHTDENHDLLVSAQALCREGILKRLDENPAPDWSALVLGAPP